MTQKQFKQYEVEGMHCIEIKANSFKSFKALINRKGGEVSIVSRYQDKGMRILDVEVSKDTRAIDLIEREFSLGAMFGNRDQGLTVVEAVCDYSHNVDSGEWEDACGKAQDSINAEYICNKGLTVCQAELKR